MLYIGRHLIGASSTTQNVVALSSGESEYHGLVKTSSRALGLQALARDFGLELSVKVLVDSTACKGIASRRGVGKIRHLHVQVLWVQSAVQDGKISVLKVAGTENSADLGTKHLAAREMVQSLQRAGLRLEREAVASALQAAV